MLLISFHKTVQSSYLSESELYWYSRVIKFSKMIRISCHLTSLSCAELCVKSTAAYRRFFFFFYKLLLFQRNNKGIRGIVTLKYIHNYITMQQLHKKIIVHIKEKYVCMYMEGERERWFWGCAHLWMPFFMQYDYGPSILLSLLKNISIYFLKNNIHKLINCPTSAKMKGKYFS